MYYDFLFDEYRSSLSEKEQAKIYLRTYLNRKNSKDEIIESKNMFFNEAIKHVKDELKNPINSYDKKEEPLFIRTNTSPISKEEQTLFEQSTNFSELDAAFMYRNLKLVNSIYSISTIYSSEWNHENYVFRKPDLDKIIKSLILAKENSLDELEPGYLNMWYTIIKDSFYKDGYGQSKPYISRYFDVHKNEIGGTKEEYWVTISKHLDDFIYAFEVLATENDNIERTNEYENLLHHFYIRTTGEYGDPYSYYKPWSDNYGSLINIDSLVFKAHSDHYIDKNQFVLLKDSVVLELEKIEKNITIETIKNKNTLKNSESNNSTKLSDVQKLETNKSTGKSKNRKIIEEEFKTLRNLDKIFIRYQDYDYYVDLLVDFFDNNSFKFERQIILKKRTKGKISNVLRNIHQKATSNRDLKNDTQFHEIVRVLSHYSELDSSTLIHDLQR